LAGVRIVAVERYIQVSYRWAHAFNLLNLIRQSVRQRGASAQNADEREALNPPILLEDLMGKTRERSPNLLGIHHAVL
jgi:hypothetical protein